MDWDEFQNHIYYGQPRGCAPRAAVLLLLLTLLLGGCKTKEYVYTERTDTLFVHKTDTVKDVHIKWQKKDSIVHDSVIVKQDMDGKPIEIHHWHTEKVTDIQRDSVDKYKAKCDSLTQKVKEAKKNKAIITKTNYSGWWAFGSLLLSVIVAIISYFLIRYKTRK